MKRTFERSSYTEYEDESSVESNPDEYYDDEYHDNFERDGKKNGYISSAITMP